jgi:hypothetical protein
LTASNRVWYVSKRMNTKPVLELKLEEAWKQLQAATSNTDWLATQQAFRKMAPLQDLNEQSLSLQQRIDALAQDAPPSIENHYPDPGPSPRNGAVSRKRSTVRPKELLIGRTARVPITLSLQIQTETAEWILKQQGKLPVIPRYISRNKADFSPSVFPSANTVQLSDGSWIEIGDSQDTALRKARNLLDTCGFKNVGLEVVLTDDTRKTA